MPALKAKTGKTKQPKPASGPMKPAKQAKAASLAKAKATVAPTIAKAKAKATVAPTITKAKAKATVAPTITKAKAKEPRAAETLEDGRIEKSQVKSAAAALLALHQKQKAESKGEKTKQNLLADADDDATEPAGSSDAVYLVVGLKKVPLKPDVRPAAIPLAHGLLRRDAEVLLITKDPQREYKDLLANKGITGVTRVMGISKLRARYKPYEAKRQLLASYDLFLADQRVLPLLPKLLGKKFFEAKRLPLPIDLTRPSKLQAQIDAARTATSLQLRQGGCTLVRVGRLSQSADAIAENVCTAVPAIVRRLHREWRNVQGLYLKTANSMALPLYGALPDQELPRVGQLHMKQIREAKAAKLALHNALVAEAADAAISAGDVAADSESDD